MAESLAYILLPTEIGEYVKQLKLSNMNDFGSKQWFQTYECLQKLHQQAVLEAQSNKEESVKEALLSLCKVPVLVHEAICVSVWREKVLPGMLELEPDPNTTLIPYIILLHEATAVAMLDTVLFHEDGCEALGDCALELVEYCAFACASLLSAPPPVPAQPSVDTAGIQQFTQQHHDLRFQTAMRCVTILSYLAQNLHSLPLSATCLVFSVHDMPLLFANLIESFPWMKTESSGRVFRYEDGKWQRVTHSAGKVTCYEAQLWIALRQLLLDPNTSAHYEINESRRNHLVKLQSRMSESLLDQIPPLVDLRSWLARLAVSGQLPHSRRPLILEVTQQLRSSFLSKSRKQWEKLIQQHTSRMLQCSAEVITSVAHSLNEVYNLDTLEALEKPPSCEMCGRAGTKRCSRCHVAVYCGRECQLQNWKNHKETCDSIAESTKSGASK